MTNPVITFRLFRGDMLLGTLMHSVPQENLAWYGAVFEPSAEFERVRPLFENELHLLKSRRLPEWREMWGEIQKPGLRLEPLGEGPPITSFVIHIENDQAWWK